MTAIAELSDDVEVIAFVDADADIRKDWLTLLIQPLQDKRIGATVGARFYHPHALNATSFIEAIWVNFQIALQGDHRLTMIWGGSNAIRRESFEAGKVLQRWENAPIEDHNLTHAVRDLKLKVHFVPDCIAITHTNARTWKQMLEFTNRQLVMTFRMGHRIQWVLSLITFLPKGLARVWMHSIDGILFSTTLSAALCSIYRNYQLSPLLLESATLAAKGTGGA